MRTTKECRTLSREPNLKLTWGHIMQISGGLVTLGFVVALAACSGGSSGPGPLPATPTPGATATPVSVMYTAKIVWAGPMAPTGVPAIAALARTQNALQSSNILLPAADTTSPASIGGQDGVAYVYAQVSPQPSAYPSTSFATTSEATVVPTPTPDPSVSPDPSASPLPPSVTLTATNIAQGGKTVSATLAAPVSQTVAQNIIIYPRLTVYCDPSYNPQAGEVVGGATWNGTSWVQATDISTADLYITGYACVGSYHDGTVALGNDTIHFPAGGNVASNSVSFDSIVASSWTNAETSDLKTNIIGKVIVFKTASGAIAKVLMIVYGNGAVSFVVETHGQGLDSF